MQRIIILSFICFLFSCTRYSPEIGEVLKQAGSNRSELEQVLKHYSRNPADSLKLRAAEFLIVNMPGKYSEYYDAPWNDVASVAYRWTSSSDKRRVLDAYKLGERVVKDDVKFITAEYLINNIDLAFKVWHEVPWGKHVPFDAFCEEILPYRVNTEPLENWREKALASFADPYDEFLKNDTVTAVQACTKINSLLPRFKVDKDFPPMCYSQLITSARGPCDNMAALAAFTMRALGIPVTIDFTVRWPAVPWSNSGHTWNSVRDSCGNHISFMGADSNPTEPHQGTTLLKSKAYRRMFVIQNQIHAKPQHIPIELRDNIIDISSEHAGMADIEIPVKYEPSIQSGYAYLASRHDLEWHPVAYGETDGKTIRFAAVGKNIFYRPVYYVNGIQMPAGDLFCLDNDGNINYCDADELGIPKIDLPTWMVKPTLFLIGDATPIGWDNRNALPMALILYNGKPAFTFTGQLNNGSLKFITTLGTWDSYTPKNKRGVQPLIRIFKTNNPRCYSSRTLSRKIFR